MIEKIGQVMLDDTYYPGKDLYTDGEIEDELLEIARTYPEEQWNQVVADKKSWPILYHYSHVRENIVSWIPFTGKESVLEIGSGCGAVTGALCKKAGKVTCIELSRKRSMINACRHQRFGNLTILMGNFQEIEESLTEQYDYITLIGVFEYGEAYIQSENPYPEFLRVISRHLKPDGKIVLAIENRFGLKYWAGCTEDHFGTLFEGLEGYPSTKGVKTFTKKEMTEILKEAGNLQASWFYPFPDYKLPMTIYSDRRLPKKGELNRLDMNYDRLRLKLFQESAVYDSLIDNDLFPEFSNSFLLLIGKNPEAVHTDIVYAKFSNERNERFSLRTDILEIEAGERLVEKCPAYPEGDEHLENILRVSERLALLYGKEGLEVNACYPGEKGVQLEYLTGETLEEQLDRLLKKGDLKGLERLLFAYVDRVKRLHSLELFRKTPEFIEVFGDAALKGRIRCGSLSNIDLVPANLVIDGSRVSVIDYEWTFDFPVPGNFIVFRMLHYYLESDSKREVLKPLDFYGKAGLTEEELEIYRTMEGNFQKYMQGSHVPLTAMYRDVSPGRADARLFYEKAKNNGHLTVYFDRGEGFKEKDTAFFRMDGRGVSAVIPIEKDVRGIRLDPGEGSCALRLKKLSYCDGTEPAYAANGLEYAKKEYYFGAGDPQFIISELKASATAVLFDVEYADEEAAQQKSWIQMQNSVTEKEQEIALLKEQIRQMEGTKVWKLYRSLKKN